MNYETEGRCRGREKFRSFRHLFKMLSMGNTLQIFIFCTYYSHKNKKLVQSLQLSHHSWISRYLKWSHILVKPELVPFTLEGILHEE